MDDDDDDYDYDDDALVDRVLAHKRREDRERFMVQLVRTIEYAKNLAVYHSTNICVIVDWSANEADFMWADYIQSRPKQWKIYATIGPGGTAVSFPDPRKEDPS